MTNVTFPFKSFLKHFRDDTKGTVAIEAVIIVPALFWAFLAMAGFFDRYKTRSSTEKAAFTISDMLSRETAAVNEAYINNAMSLFESMSKLDNVDALRISVIAYDSSDDEHSLDWSFGTGLDTGLAEADLVTLKDKLPVMVDGERLILVQSFGTYDPPVNIGMNNISMNTFVFTRPRFAPQLAWSAS